MGGGEISSSEKGECVVFGPIYGPLKNTISKQTTREGSCSHGIRLAWFKDRTYGDLRGSYSRDLDGSQGRMYRSEQSSSPLGLTRESLFEILARSETRFLDPKFLRDSRKTREFKLVARLTSLKSCRQIFHSETCEKRVSLRNFVTRFASYRSRRKKFRCKTRFSQV
jgi:hypothetical protein